MAARHLDDLPGHPASRLTREQDNDICNVGRRAEATQWNGRTGPNHGFAIARRIQHISKSILRVEQGSLYPALHRMELDGLIEAYWDTTENNRRAKYYRLTRRGTRELAKETERWNAISGAITAILQEA